MATLHMSNAGCTEWDYGMGIPVTVLLLTLMMWRSNEKVGYVVSLECVPGAFRTTRIRFCDEVKKYKKMC